MRCPIVVAALAVSLWAETPNCTGIARDVNARCGCVRDPNSQLCAMVKAGFYDSSKDFTKPKGLNQIPFGKQLSVRLEGGVVTAPPR